MDIAAQIVNNSGDTDDGVRVSRAAKGHRRNRPLLAGTVDELTARLAAEWVAKARSGRRRSIGQWIDRLVERAEGRDRERAGHDRAVRQAVAVEIRTIADCVTRVRLGCDPPVWIHSLNEIRAAAHRIEVLMREQ